MESNFLKIQYQEIDRHDFLSYLGWKTSAITIPGDVLLVTAFLSYMGCFTRMYRSDLINENWLPFLEKLEVKIPRTADLDILAMLSDDAVIAQWNNEGKFFLTFFELYILHIENN